jgi:hypothetical protein
MSEDEEAREMFGPARAMAEPLWNPDGAVLARTGRRQKRMRTVVTGAGATLSAAALFGGLAFAHGGSGSSAASGSAAALVQPVKVDPAVWEKQVDIDMNLPALINGLLPDGLDVSWVSTGQAKTAHLSYSNAHGAFRLAGKDRSLSVLLSAYNLPLVKGTHCPGELWAPPTSTPGVTATCTPTKVPGGTVHAWSQVQRADGKAVSSSYSYVYIPDDKKGRTFQVLLLNDTTDHPLLTAEQFVAMVQKPDFAKLTALVDPAVPPAAASTAKRAATDAEVAKAVGAALPSGFALRLPTSDLPGDLELTGPHAGRSGISWQAFQGNGAGYAESCKGEFRSEYSLCEEKSVPGGKLFAAHLDRAMPGYPIEHWTGYSFIPADGSPRVTADLNDSTSTPGLTEAEFLAVAKTPGIAQTLASVRSMIDQ